jgi:cytochrome b involved in lipid metabolism
MRPLVPAEFNIFDSITGLPMHPLVVHFAVVLLPLAAIMLITLVFVPKWRAAFGWFTMAGLIAGTVAAFVAKQTGEAFAAHVGLPQDHAVWGDALVVVAVVLVVVAGIWFWLQRPVAIRQAKGRAPAIRATGILAVALAATATLMTIVVGHSGATAVWDGRLNPVQAPEVSTSAPATPGATAPSSAKTITLAEVGQHASASSCWTAVGGKVYDLTKWINNHPGGPNRILGMCGKDATAAFQSQHGPNDPAVSILNSYLIGSLG